MPDRNQNYGDEHELRAVCDRIEMLVHELPERHGAISTRVLFAAITSMSRGVQFSPIFS